MWRYVCGFRHARKTRILFGVSFCALPNKTDVSPIIYWCWPHLRVSRTEDGVFSVSITSGSMNAKQGAPLKRSVGFQLPLVLTEKQTAKLLGVDPEDVSEMLRTRALRSIWVNGRRMICGFTVERLLA